MRINDKLKRQNINFCRSKDTEMTDEEFVILLITFPAFLVANSDGNFDEDEKNLMATLLHNFLQEIYGKELNEEQYESMIISYLEDFLWIYEHTEWKEKLVGGLKILCNDIDGLNESVKEMMQEMAEVSEGESQEETEVIADLISTIDQEDNFEDLGL